MRIYKVTIIEEGSSAIFAIVHGLAETIEDAMEIAMAEVMQGFDGTLSKLEVSSVSLIARCAFVQETTRKAA